MKATKFAQNVYIVEIFDVKNVAVLLAISISSSNPPSIAARFP